MPIQTIQFPFTVETYWRSLQEILVSFFDGQEHAINSEKTVAFYDCEFHYGLELLDNPPNKPTVSFAGSRLSNEQEFFCDKPDGILRRLRRCTLHQTAYVAVPLGATILTPPGDSIIAKEQGSERMAYRIWDLLNAVMSTQKVALATRGFQRAWLDQFPSNVSSGKSTDKIVIVSGGFHAKLESRYQIG